jgi:hypothetical protein
MGEVSRRRFLTQTSVGVGITLATVASLPRVALAPSIVPTLQNASSGEPIRPAPLAEMSWLEPMVLHVRDVATAEITVLVGTQEFVYRDPELVARLVQTAKQASETGS